MMKQTPPEFPCDALPDDPAASRLLGLYPQRQDGRWMQRVKALGGVLTAAQWRALGAAAAELTGGTALHLTTRQEIELHDLSADQVPDVQRRIAAAGLPGLGACGDTLRNVTVCPHSGVRSGAADLLPLAWAVRRTLEALDGIYTLPRKFKISLAACADACAGPWNNDLGFVARRRDGAWGFEVMIAGSLGARPGTGIRLFDHLPAADVLPLVVAAVRLFAQLGDRTNRRRARLRHVRERLGDEAFAQRMTAALEEARLERDWPPVDLPEVADGHDAQALLTFPNGDVTPAAADALAALADCDDLRVRIGLHHRVHVFGRDDKALRRAIGSQLELTGAARPQPTIVACPGTRWCSRALVDTNTLADRIRRELGGVLNPAAVVCISGCPNGCAHSAAAPIGLIGGLKKVDGRSAEAFDLYLGGDLGRSAELAALAARKLTVDEVLAHLRQR